VGLVAWWVVAWLVGRLADWLVDWFGRLVGWLVCYLFGWFLGWLVCGLVCGSLRSCLVDSLSCYKILDWIKDDEHYIFLVPSMIVTVMIFAYWNWVSMKFFRHN
jgi:hypothetical protein